MVIMARPPLTQPTRALARSMSRFEMPALVIRPPARMKSGMASSGNFDPPPKIMSGMAASGAVPWSATTTMVAIARTKPMGTLSAERPMTTAEDEPAHGYCPSSIGLARTRARRRQRRSAAPARGTGPPETTSMSAPEIGMIE